MHPRLDRPDRTEPTGDPQQGSVRARPLPPDQRRAMLVAATARLLAEHGTKVTTRQIAQAAGVAEGTIFRVFPDKDALVRASLAHCLDPLPALAEIRGLDPELPLPERVAAMAAVLQRRLVGAFNVLLAAALAAVPTGPGAGAPSRRTPPDCAGPRAARPSDEMVLAAMVDLLEPDREQFRCPVTEVARLLRLVCFAGSHPLVADGRLLAPQEIAALVLDGVRRRPAPAGSGECTAERGDVHC